MMDGYTNALYEEKDAIIVELQHKIRGLEHSLAGKRANADNYRRMWMKEKRLREEAERDRDRYKEALGGEVNDTYG